MVIIPLAHPDVFEILKSKSGLVQKALDAYLPARGSSEMAELNSFYEMLWDYNLRGGKRLRPALCLLTCEMFGGKQERALPSAVAFELMHNFLLIHDDFEDGSELRRGAPCLHRIHGAPAAINAGDGLFAKTWQALLANRRLIGAGRALKVFDEFARQCDYTVQGQAIELGWVASNKWDVEEKDYYKLVELKTAHYTTTTPMRVGAICGGAPMKEANAIDKFGLLFGTAFQIQDDVLNLAGSEKEMGKEVGGDIHEGKRTLALLHAYRKARGKEKQELVEIMAKPRERKTPEEVTRVLEIMNSLGSVEYAKKKALERAAEAKKVFGKKFSHIKDSEAKQSVEAIIDYVVERKY